MGFLDTLMPPTASITLSAVLYSVFFALHCRPGNTPQAAGLCTHGAPDTQLGKQDARAAARGKHGCPRRSSPAAIAEMLPLGMVESGGRISATGLDCGHILKYRLRRCGCATKSPKDSADSLGASRRYAEPSARWI